MSDDKSLLKTASRLLENNDLSLDSWNKIFSSMHEANLLNLVAAARTALEYGTKNKILKGLPKKSWEHAKQTNDGKETEEFIKHFELILQQKKIKTE